MAAKPSPAFQRPASRRGGGRVSVCNRGAVARAVCRGRLRLAAAARSPTKINRQVIRLFLPAASAANQRRKIAAEVKSPNSPDPAAAVPRPCPARLAASPAPTPPPRARVREGAVSSASRSRLRTTLAAFADHGIAGILQGDYGEEVVVGASPSALGDGSDPPSVSSPAPLPPRRELRLCRRRGHPARHARHGQMQPHVVQP
jgi:hypothetical protein